MKTVAKGAKRKGPRRIRLSKRNCRFCNNPQEIIDFKDVELLKKYQTEKGKILPRRLTGNCMMHQKVLAKAIKRARELALVF